MAILDQLSFGVDTKHGFTLTDAHCVLDRPQGMEPDKMRDVPQLLQSFPNQARKPIMAMDQIIPKPILLPEIFEVAGEIGEMRIEFQLAAFLPLLP